MGIKEKIAAIFAKAQDEASKVADEEAAGKQISGDEGAYDELVKVCNELGSKLDGIKALMAPKDESKRKKRKKKKRPRTRKSPLVLRTSLKL
jgi:hypothetical protein